MDGIEQFAELFAGSDLAHGVARMTETVSRRGKRESKSWTEPTPATLDDFKKHVQGALGLGIPPIRSDSMCRWGAIDIDIYEGLDLKEFARQVSRDLPFLQLCRSKSGGPHLFLFLSDWEPAVEVVEVLESIAAYLGFATSEIFPKQVAISKEGDASDYGNWINLPYYGGVANLRYGLDASGRAITSIADFVQQVCREKRAKLGEIKDNLPGGFSGKGNCEETTEGDGNDTSLQLFADGPPCLQRIWSAGVTDNRNVTLANACVYLKKAFPSNWKEKLDEYNRALPEPLPSDEIEALKRSYEKKDYKYQCRKEPLCRHCFSRLCRERPFGVGGDGLVANNRSLSKFDSNPPIWFLDVDLPDGSVRRISLSTEQLQRFSLFQRRVMECLNQCPSNIKQEDWIAQLQGLMKHVSVIHVPDDVSPEGQLAEMLESFLANRASEEDWEDITRDLAYRDLGGFHFRFTSFHNYLQSNRFNDLSRNAIAAFLKDSCGATSHQRKINERNIRYWTIPNSDIQRVRLSPKGTQADQPF
jgi:hypothetical protein